MTKNTSPIGLQRFTFYLNQLQALLETATTTANPAKTLYEQNVRTPLFMLEALARMYEKLHNKKNFGKQKEHFKLLEDLLGKVDYYDALHKDICNDKKIPASIKKYLDTQTDAALVVLNETLLSEGWIGDNNKRITKIFSKINEADWLSEEEDAIAVKKQYQKTINNIVEDIVTNTINFDNVEEDVHELRRKLRWLSIYPHCFQGLFQFQKSEKPTAIFKKYLTTAIVQSPYNKMPPKGHLKTVILLKTNNFLALSWMIAELGKLKDNGLKIEAITAALLATTKSQEKQAIQNAYKLCGPEQMTMEAILALAKKESDLFFEENLLESMVVV